MRFPVIHPGSSFDPVQRTEPGRVAARDPRGIGSLGGPRCRNARSIDTGLKIIAKARRRPPQGQRKISVNLPVTGKVALVQACDSWSSPDLADRTNRRSHHDHRELNGCRKSVVRNVRPSSRIGRVRPVFGLAERGWSQRRAQGQRRGEDVNGSHLRFNLR